MMPIRPVSVALVIAIAVLALAGSLHAAPRVRLQPNTRSTTAASLNPAIFDDRDLTVNRVGHRDPSRPNDDPTMLNLLGRIRNSLDEAFRPDQNRDAVQRGPIDARSNYCAACEATIALLQHTVQQNESVKVVQDTMFRVCVWGSRALNLSSMGPTVCRGVLLEYTAEFLQVLGDRFLSPTSICTHFRFCAATAERQASAAAWVDDLLAKYPKPEASAAAKTAAAGPGTTNENAHAFLHLTDIHVDPMYSVGSKTWDCGEPMCCRSDNGPGVTPELTAGRWGDYHCDLTEIMMNDLLQSASSAPTEFGIPEPDFILWTGDNTPHDDWELAENFTIPEARRFILSTHWIVADGITKSFPNVPVYPTFGNHGLFPTDQFDGRPVDSWVLDNITALWSRWLPASALETVAQYGYYTVLHRPGHRIIALNTQFCDVLNFWLLANLTDPFGQLAWLADVLYAAERDGESVYLIGHIPPAGDGTCIIEYSHKIHAIIERFAVTGTITGMFFGHTHTDQFAVYRDAETRTREIGVLYIAPSATTYTFLNPSYRMFTYDPQSTEVQDYHQMYADLGEALVNDQPTWRLAYSAREEYGMTDLSPQSWGALAERLKTDSALFQKYQFHYNTQYIGAGECDDVCRQRQLCTIEYDSFDQVLDCYGPNLSSSDLLVIFLNAFC